MTTLVIDRIRVIGEELKTGGAGPFHYSDGVTEIPEEIIPRLTGGDIRNYSVDNDIATDEGNAIDRPNPVPVAELYQYFVENQFKINGNEPSNSPLAARLAMVVATGTAWIQAQQELNNTGSPKSTDQEWPSPSDIRPVFWPTTFRDTAGTGLTNGEHAECAALLSIVDAVGLGGGAGIDTDNAAFNQMLNSAEACGVMSTAQKNEIKGRKSNRISRASEIGTGNWRVGDVEAGRVKVP